MTPPRNSISRFALVASIVLAPLPAAANELVFQFTNPSFGGNPLNGSFLFGLADAQRGATASDADNGGEATGGIGGAPTVGGTGGIGGPTIIIPIVTGDGDVPGVEVGNPTNVDQVAN